MAKYGKKAQQKVKTNMDEMKSGKLKSGKSGQKVTNPKQAIAIGLSEARKASGKVPPNPNAKKSSPKKSAPKKAAKKTVKKTAPKKAAKKSAAKKTVKKTAKKSR